MIFDALCDKAAQSFGTAARMHRDSHTHTHTHAHTHMLAMCVFD